MFARWKFLKLHVQLRRRKRWKFHLSDPRIVLVNCIRNLQFVRRNFIQIKQTRRQALTRSGHLSISRRIVRWKRYAKFCKSLNVTFSSVAMSLKQIYCYCIDAQIRASFHRNPCYFRCAKLEIRRSDTRARTRNDAENCPYLQFRCNFVKDNRTRIYLVSFSKTFLFFFF